MLKGILICVVVVNCAQTCKSSEKVQLNESSEKVQLNTPSNEEYNNIVNPIIRNARNAPVPVNYIEVVATLMTKMKQDFPQTRGLFWSCAVGSEYGIRVEGIKYYINTRITNITPKVTAFCYIH